MEIGHKLITSAIFSLLLIQVGHTRLGSLKAAQEQRVGYIYAP